MDMQYIFVRHDEKRTHTGCAIGATRSAGEPPPRRPARTVWMNLVYWSLEYSLVGAYLLAISKFSSAVDTREDS
jgi:hypothetical protein